jgi:NADPH:quinone reductase-like Zn-dependent oxidoreductase
MRAAVVTRYGPPEVVRVLEVTVPTPAAGEVLVRVVSAAVSSGDARIRGARFPGGFAPFARLALGLRRPRRCILGSACSGVVEALGSEVDGFAVGDEVCALVGMKMGAHAEHVAVKASKLVAKPADVSHDDAAGVLFGGSTALWFLRDKGAVRPGMHVLVNGASGAIGTNAVQLAKRAGATVTAVCSAANAPLATKLGADRVVDYAANDISTLDQRFDLVFDTVGTISIPTGRRLLRPGGRLLLAVATLGQTLRARGDVVAGTSPERAEMFAELVQLLADGELAVVIERTYDLDEIAAAHRHVDTGRKVGNLVVHP